MNNETKMFGFTNSEASKLLLKSTKKERDETNFNPAEAPLKVQASGHKFVYGASGKPMPAVIDQGDGYILKAMQKPPRGERELCFYQQITDQLSTDTSLQMLKPFLPHFEGKVDRDEGSYLKLSNLIDGYHKPCVLDLKMGRITYDCMATQEKILGELKKFPPAQKLGFQITGMVIYDPEKETYKKVSKDYTRKLTEETIVPDGLGLFFQLKERKRKNHLLNQLLSKLHKLEQWFSVQRKFSFIASSLLITFEGYQPGEGKPGVNVEDSFEDGPRNIEQPFSYDGESTEYALGNFPLNDQHEDPSKNTDKFFSTAVHVKQDESSADEVGLHLIDFAHVFPSDTIDHNVLFGIQKLISCLQSMIVHV